MKPEDFAQALFERRLTDYGIDVEYRDSSIGKITIREPLHDKSPARLIEAVENVAKTIYFSSDGMRSKLVCGRFNIMSSDLHLSVFEFKGIV